MLKNDDIILLNQRQEVDIFLIELGILTAEDLFDLEDEFIDLLILKLRPVKRKAFKSLFEYN